MVVERDLGFDIESETLPDVYDFFFNLAKYTCKHTRAHVMIFFYRKFDAVLINVVASSHV